MSAIYQSGPVGIFIGFGREENIKYEIVGDNPSSEYPINTKKIRTDFGDTPKHIMFLGYGEIGLHSEIRAEWKEIQTDRAGGKVPEDICYTGKHAYTHVILKRWNEKVLQLCQARPYVLELSSGENSYADIGKLILAQKLAFSLYLLYFRGQTDSNKRNAGVEGFRFPFNTVLFSPDIRQIGSQKNQVSLMFYSLPRFSNKKKTFILYDQEMKDLQAFNGYGGSGPNTRSLLTGN